MRAPSPVRARRRVVPAVEVHHAGRRVDDVGERGARAPRARLTEAGDGAVDEIAPHGGERVVVRAEARRDAGREILHDDVRAAREIAHDGLRRRLAQIERDALLARVHAHEVRALIVAALLELMRRAAHVVAAARLLDLDDARAEIGEEARAVRAGEDAREVENDEARQEWIGRHRRSIERRTAL
jgi:hypothetical protein